MSEQNNQDQNPDIEISTKEPSFYNVFLLNDDFTTQEFVVKVLTQFFYKSDSEAFKLMLEVHNNGRALVGTFTKEIAETKIYLVHQAARENEFPLKCSMEEC
ncbi:MAG: ATP-dependent Clp protease adaptor ClpS [Bdellovibrionales bacterium]